MLILKNILLRYIIFIVSIPVIYSCRQQPNDACELLQKAHSVDDSYVAEVDVMIVEEGIFRVELISTGKLRALRKSRISFRNSDMLIKVHVINGQFVEEGEVLAEQCRERLERQLKRAAITKKQATLEMEYLLLGHGYTLTDSLAVPNHIWEMSGISSGYIEAFTQYKHLLDDLEKTRVKAPFSGYVSELDAHQWEQVTAGNIFCTLLDKSAIAAEFPIMEHELQMLEIGQHVSISLFSNQNKTFQGTIKSINPVVDENGQILVLAMISEPGGLMEGMNVQVTVHTNIQGQLTVPKSAVLYRDNMEVLFRYENGEAVWTYVSTQHQNSSHYSVIASPGRVSSLAHGDTVIVAGNMNLAHRSAVKIR